MEEEHKPYSGDRWKYHKGEYRVVSKGNVKLTPEQQAKKDEFIKACLESIRANKHQQ